MKRSQDGTAKESAVGKLSEGASIEIWANPGLSPASTDRNANPGQSGRQATTSHFKRVDDLGDNSW